MSRPPLPPHWVDEIFGRLTVRYGQPFLRRWEGVDIALVKADWAEQLAGFADKPDAIRHALENLPPDRAPTVGEFAAVANRHQPATPALPAPKPDPARAHAAVAAIGRRLHDHDPRAWAQRLRDREAAGEPLSLAQRHFWREALRVEEGAAA